jgi:tetratricopeptide (TPR) repeat protein
MKGEHMSAGIRPLMIALLLFPVAVPAADDPASGAGTDPVLQSARQAVAGQDYAKAAGILREALVKAPANADYHNLYAYAVRKGPNPDLDLAFKHYNEALRIEPKHRGAHEYIGEAYLMVGNVQKAREHLTQLDRLCFFGCAEYTSLKQAVQDYEAKLKR